MTGLPAPLTPLLLESGEAPSPGAAAQRLRREGVTPTSWSNGPGDRYGAHAHSYTKLLICAQGSITFEVGSRRTPVPLAAGDGFVLPAGTEHGAVVGPDGCVCVEGHRAG